MSDKLQGGVLAGSVDVSLTAMLSNTSDNLGTSGLTSASSGLILSYWRQGGTRTAVSASDLAAVNSSHSDGGMKEVDATNMTGMYRFDWPDAAFATGADWVILFVEVTGSYSWFERLQLTTNVIASVDVASRLAPTTAGRTLDVTAAGEAGLDFNNVAIPDGAVPAIGIAEGGTAQSATATTLVGRAAESSANNVPVGCILGALGSDQGYWQFRVVTGYVTATDTYTVDTWTVTPSGTITYRVYAGSPGSTTAPAPADVRFWLGATAPANTGDAFARIGAAGAGLTDLGGMSTTMKGQVQTEAEDALVANNLDHLLKVAAVAGDVTDSSVVARLASKSATPAFSSYDNTTDSLEANRDNIGTTGVLLTPASVGGAVGSVTGNVGGNVTGSVGSLATQAKADVNAEVVDALATDTYAEPGQGAPAATASLAAKIGYLFKAWRNKKTETSTEAKLFADDGSTVDQKSTLSDDGSTYTAGEVASGP